MLDPASRLGNLSRRILNGEGGFTLIEMSIVIAVIGIITVGMVSMGSSMVASAQRVSTTNKLDAIETALMAYRLGNNRLPCPADPTVTDIPAHALTYGVETGTAGICTPLSNTVSATIAAASGTTVVEGAIPVRTLGLPDEFQFDGWGRKFAYAVWTPLTAASAFIIYGITPSCGAITVSNASGGHRSTAAAYALISYGPDGHGGYTTAGARYNAGVSNVDEVANAHYNSSGADTGLYAATYVQKEYSAYASDNDSAHPFGHQVRYKERWQMQNAYDTYQPAPATPTAANQFCLYAHRKAITIVDTNVGSADLTNFPLLVTFAGDTDIGAAAQSGGQDIRFTASDGATLLNYERESFSISGAAATGVFWVNVPTISHTANTTIYIYYGSPTASDGNNTTGATWNSNYAAVYHLPNGTTLSANDSTSNANNGTITGAVADTGKINGAAKFTPSTTNNISIASLPAFSSDFSVDFWVKMNSLFAYELFNVGYNQAHDVLFISSKADGTGLRMGRSGDAEDANAAYAWSTGLWYHVAFTRSGTTLTFYVNGSPLITTISGSNSASYVAGRTLLGGDGVIADTAYTMDGDLDEFRFSSAALSAGWIGFEYHNIIDAGNDLTFGGEQAP